MIQAILFDAAGTLLHVHPSVGDVYADEAARFGVQLRADALNDTFKRVWGTLRHAQGQTPFHTSEAVERKWWEQLVRKVFEEVGEVRRFDPRFGDFFDALYLRFEHPDCWRLYEDVIPLLDVLDDRGIPLAVISNWDSRLPRLLSAMGIAERFQFILTSAEAGVSKPSPAIFEEAIRRFGVLPENTLHVGDSVEEDLLAAERVGIQAALLSRSGAPNQSKTITSLLSVLDIL
jgi:putative hydrolase of the HAD superfamily